MADTVHDLARRAGPVSDVLSDTGETAKRFGEVYQTTAAVPDERMLGQEHRIDRLSRWRGLPRRAMRALRRCRAVLRIPEELGQLNCAIDAKLADVEQQLRNFDDKQRATFTTALRTEFTGIQEQLRCLAEKQAHFVPEAFAELQRELSTQMAFSLHDFARGLVGQHRGTQIEQQSGEQAMKLESIENHLNRLANEQFETKNQLTHVGTNTESLLQNLTTIAGEIRNAAIHLGTSLEARLNTIEYERLDGLYDQMHHVTAALLRLRANTEKDRAERPRLPAERYAPAQSRSLEADLQRAQAEFPQVFPMWAERLEEMRKACLETKTGNVAHAGDPRSEAFRSLVEIHAVGRVLDVGCGIFGRPFYLSSYPASLISGLDPLEPSESVDFEFVRGIQEYLPWPDGAFSTVISATALDHCLSLDRSLAEIRRVLCPGGKLLLWLDSFPGLPRFAPDAPDFTPADRFHLFHFDAAWFEPMLARWFEVIDRIVLRGIGFDRIMLCLRLVDAD